MHCLNAFRFLPIFSIAIIWLNKNMHFYFFLLFHVFFQMLPLMGALFESRTVSCAPGAAGPCSGLLCPGSGPVKPAKSGNQPRGDSSSFSRIMFCRSCCTAVCFHNAGRHATAAEPQSRRAARQFTTREEKDGNETGSPCGLRWPSEAPWKKIYCKDDSSNSKRPTGVFYFQRFRFSSPFFLISMKFVSA